MTDSITTENRQWGTVVRVQTGRFDFEYFSGFSRHIAQTRAYLFKKLADRYGISELPPRGTNLEKFDGWTTPAKAACLRAQGYSINQIAGRMELQPDSVEQYISDFRQGRR